MPLLEYGCWCGNKFEKILSSHRDTYPCPKCNRNAEQIMSRSTVQFKGSCHANDYHAPTKQ